ncbi:DUF4339 domain-containing protein [Flavobacterium sp. MAHUQ-51]|uniref:DUF4339 domain-containing protein n=1 Tax=Flavobacterium sp. GCM10022190 TaxID=3252639 RepID=UPI0036188047
MKKYYLHNGIESSGPFDLTELQMKQITATTPVWFSGLADWKTAGEIEELQSILKVIPPPFKAEIPNPEPESKSKQKETKTKIMGLSKNNFYLVCLLFIVIIGSFALSIFEEKRKEELEEINHKTEIENRQFLLKEKELQEQKKQAEEQERAEAERIAKERKESISKRLDEIQIEKTQNQTLLDEAKSKLNRANEFQLFRSADEKSRELNALQTEITHLKSELEILENEQNQLSLELERLQLTH